MFLINRDDGVDQLHTLAMGDQVFNLFYMIHLLKREIILDSIFTWQAC